MTHSIECERFGNKRNCVACYDDGSKYKCENHKLDFVCGGCMRAWIARHDQMLLFISYQTLPHLNDEHMEQLRMLSPKRYCRIMNARSLLKELGLNK